MSFLMNNARFEMELRILLLLSSDVSSAYSINRLVCFDFIACYSQRFQINDENLHGQCPYMFGELCRRRGLIQEAVTNLVRKKFIDVSMKEGFSFSISKKGIEYISKIECEYTIKYKKYITDAIEKYKQYSTLNLTKHIEYLVFD